MKYLLLTCLTGYMIYDMYSIGGILYRLDQDGNNIISPKSIVHMLIAPLIIKEFWSTNLIKSNYILLYSLIIICSKKK